MESHPLILIILLISFNLLLQGFVATPFKNEKLRFRRRLDIKNNPATKTFVTKHGDILDCVDIDKQPAFDHPLLKNQSIQVKPTQLIGRPTSVSTTSSQFLPKRMRCPQGTVPIKRVKKEDLVMQKVSPLLGTTPMFPTSNFSNSVNGHEMAGLVTYLKNMGASGKINVWNPQVKPNQYSQTVVFVAADDGSVTNFIHIGWMVSPTMYPNSTQPHLYLYWTKDSGKTTGCYDTMCPGFVQVSRKAYLGQIITTISRKFHKQYFISVEIRQDIRTKDWWLYFEGEAVGYLPVALFSTLNGGAGRAGWGGETYSPDKEPPPEMGSGYQADLKTAFERVCAITNLKLQAPQLFPKREDLRYYMTNNSTYNVIYDNFGDYWEDFIYFGGPNKY
ncbi:hypothetical protein RND81_06G244100 [Saponaria officinalis]|uniref:Neprosin PEP catalytic domain-containing protein n=1 Tax=Saponaria officinalis TaxID=3572 RepID=A0AAW1KEV4_SAPOF